MRKLRNQTIRKALSIHPLFTLLLGCIVVLQTTLIMSPKKSVETYHIPYSYGRELQLNGSEKTFTSGKCLHCECADDNIDRDTALVFKAPKRENVKLIMGIPTINRTGESYILETISSLIQNMNDEEKKGVLILVFLADFQKSIRSFLASKLWKNFQEHIERGLVQVIEAPSTFYPLEKSKKRTYHQSKEYVHWRSKQNFDYAFMMKYAKGMSTYYMQMEDDVIAANGYVSSIYEFIQSQKEWICLEFSELGFIGKLYRNEHIENLAKLLILFHVEQPVDYTYLFYNNLMVQYGRIIKKPTLFQHMGLRSSFPGKIQRLKDKYFDVFKKEYNGDNPPADVITSMQTYMTFLPKMAYLKTEGFFWSHGSPKSGDTFTIIFENPQNLKRVVVITGSKYHPEDHIYNGRLDASLTLFKTKDGSMKCANHIELGPLINGTIAVNNLSEKIKYDVLCLTITVTKDQEQWAIVKEIAVFTT